MSEVLWSYIVPIRPSGSRPPLFLIHAVGGGCVSYGVLSNKLHAEQPALGIQARGRRPNTPPSDSIEAMVEEYLKVILERWPRGPYLLGGWCFGGIVATEIARQLNKAGRNVPLVAVIDARYGHEPQIIPEASPTDEHRREVDVAVQLLKDFQVEERLTGRESLMALRPVELLPHVLALLKTTKRWPAVFDLPELRSFVDTFKTNVKAGEKFRFSERYDGRVVLFLSDEGRLQGIDRQWQQVVASDMQVVAVPGNHWSMMMLPQAEVLARELQSAIDRALLAS